MIDAFQVRNTICTLTQESVRRTNELTAETFRTRGGRIGSGMGLLLESLWGYFTNQALDEIGEPYEVGWIATHEYNDFACLLRNVNWDPATKAGEILRIEIKSMVASADESKAHFDKILTELAPTDLLVVLIWDWKASDDFRAFPFVKDYFAGPAVEVAKLRDALHLARGGTFVRVGDCPDCSNPHLCSHVGEPLNASGKRERLSGPESTRPGKALYAANYGGLKRMLGVRGGARQILELQVQSCPVAAQYVEFIRRNFGRNVELS